MTVIGRADLMRVGLSTELGTALGYDFDPESVESNGSSGQKNGDGIHPRPPMQIGFRFEEPVEIPFLVASRFRCFDDDGEKHSIAPRPAASTIWENRPTSPPEFRPLADNANLAWHLGRIAPRIRASRKPDSERLTRRFAQARPLKTIPRKEYPAQGTMQVVYDRSPRLAPFWRDQRLAQSAVPDGSVEYVFEAAARRFLKVGARGSHFPDPEDGPLVVFGDLGAFGAAHAMAVWSELGIRFAEKAVPIFAFIPCAASDLPAGLTAIWQVTPWELSRPPLDHRERAAAVEELLMWCSYAGRVEPGLLRALRRGLTDADAASEMLVYCHDAVASPSAEALTLEPRSIVAYRERFERRARENPDKARRAWQILRDWRQPIGDEFIYEELLSLPEELRDLLEIDGEDIEHAEAFWAAMSEGAEEGALSRGTIEWLERAGRRREPDRHGLLDHDPARHAIEWAMEQRSGGRGRSDLLRIALGGGLLNVGEAGGSELGVVLHAKREIRIAPLLPDVGSTLQDPLEDGSLGPEMIVVPTGSFLMGSPEGDDQALGEEKPQHDVRITEPFALAKYPVTFEEYDAFCEATGRRKPDASGWGRGRRPAINVDWEDARAYCDWLSKQTGEAYRLPSEAEWEYACRAGTTTRYWWGDEWLPERTNADGNVGKTTEVGSYAPSPWGFHDTHGNVWEWCEDHWLAYSERPSTQQAINRTGESDRVVRGSSWLGDARLCRAAYRGSRQPDYRNDDLGFRPARGQAFGLLAGEQESAERSVGRSGDGRMAEPRLERRDGPPPRRGGEADFSSSSSMRRRVMPGGSASIPLADLPPAPFVIRTDRAELVIQRITRSDLGGWASGMGRDRFGLWADFTVGNIRQRLRWCVPGRFLMGSPKDEAGRFDDEGPRTEITFEHGFWLFETPVTQALYKAVTGGTPSHFEELDRPVERVSWGDAKAFLDGINERIPGLELVLPSEAQWEYACRAGSTTPFEPNIARTHAGGGITSAEVNFDGNHPYGDAAKFDYREETLRVKPSGFYPNAWGLWQMHGNVWEWCQDAWHDSHEGAAPDGSPRAASRQGGETDRVIRGGSWGGLARDCRAACRNLRRPGNRFDGLGFRPARGQVSGFQAGEQESAERSGLRSGEGRMAEPRLERREGPPPQRGGDSTLSRFRRILGFGKDED